MQQILLTFSVLLRQFLPIKRGLGYMCCTIVIHQFCFVFELHSAFSTFRLFTKKIELHCISYKRCSFNGFYQLHTADYFLQLILSYSFHFGTAIRTCGLFVFFSTIHATVPKWPALIITRRRR